jgi:hypothetical protein
LSAKASTSAWVNGWETLRHGLPPSTLNSQPSTRRKLPAQFAGADQRVVCRQTGIEDGGGHNLGLVCPTFRHTHTCKPSSAEIGRAGATADLGWVAGQFRLPEGREAVKLDDSGGANGAGGGLGAHGGGFRRDVGRDVAPGARVQDLGAGADGGRGDKPGPWSDPAEEMVRQGNQGWEDEHPREP